MPKQPKRGEMREQAWEKDATSMSSGVWEFTVASSSLKDSEIFLRGLWLLSAIWLTLVVFWERWENNVVCFGFLLLFVVHLLFELEYKYIHAVFINKERCLEIGSLYDSSLRHFFFFYWRMENKMVDVLIMKGIFFNVTRPTPLARPTWRKHEVWEK